MALSEKDLLEKKEEITEAKTRLSELKGEEKTLLKQMDEDWLCKSLKEAKEKIEGFTETINNLKEKIQIETEALEETYLKEE